MFRLKGLFTDPAETEKKKNQRYHKVFAGCLTLHALFTAGSTFYTPTSL